MGSDQLVGSAAAEWPGAWFVPIDTHCPGAEGAHEDASPVDDHTESPLSLPQHAQRAFKLCV